MAIGKKVLYIGRVMTSKHTGVLEQCAPLNSRRLFKGRLSHLPGSVEKPAAAMPEAVHSSSPIPGKSMIHVVS
jgi:hypothetical protein